MRNTPQNRRMLLAVLGGLMMLSGVVGLAEQFWPSAATPDTASPSSSRNTTVAMAADDVGQFDFWVLALSWLPSYCANGRDDPEQCGPGAPDGMVVHGLWPQFERGYPEFCQLGPRRIPRSLAKQMDDLIPSDDAVFHQWRKHGRCANADPKRYFETVRAASGRVSVPPVFEKAQRDGQQLPAMAIEDAFIESNPGLRRDMIGISCHSGLIRDVRICMDRDLAFRACREVDTRGCRRNLDIPSARR
jgi:ribonuclease T2